MLVNWHPDMRTSPWLAQLTTADLPWPPIQKPMDRWRNLMSRMRVCIQFVPAMSIGQTHSTMPTSGHVRPVVRFLTYQHQPYPTSNIQKRIKKQFCDMSWWKLCLCFQVLISKPQGSNLGLKPSYSHTDCWSLNVGHQCVQEVQVHVPAHIGDLWRHDQAP